MESNCRSLWEAEDKEQSDKIHNCVMHEPGNNDCCPVCSFIILTWQSWDYNDLKTVYRQYDADIDFHLEWQWITAYESIVCRHACVHVWELLLWLSGPEHEQCSAGGFDLTGDGSSNHMKWCHALCKFTFVYKFTPYFRKLPVYKLMSLSAREYSIRVTWRLISCNDITNVLLEGMFKSIQSNKHCFHKTAAGSGTHLLTYILAYKSSLWDQKMSLKQGGRLICEYINVQRSMDIKFLILV